MSGDDTASVLVPTASMRRKPYSEGMNETERQDVPAGPKRCSPKLRRLGKLPPRFKFFLNPYTDVRFTTCPNCEGRTRQRKLPLVIHVDPQSPLSLNMTWPLLSLLRSAYRASGCAGIPDGQDL